MPNLDKTGPNGDGPRTGRQKGNNQQQGNRQGNGQGNRQGTGQGNRQGNGQGNRQGTGQGRGRNK